MTALVNLTVTKSSTRVIINLNTFLYLTFKIAFGNQQCVIHKYFKLSHYVCTVIYKKEFKIVQKDS